MKKILIPASFLILSFFINPAVSQAAWWNPVTWFNNWSFTAEIETSNDSYTDYIPESTPEIKLKPAVKTKATTTIPVKKPNQSVDMISNSLPKSTTQSTVSVPAKVDTTPKASVIPVKPTISSLSKSTAYPGDVVTVFGNNFPTGVVNEVSLRNSNRDTGVGGITGSDGKSVKFTVIDLIHIPAGTYNLSIENSKGDQSNYVPFTIAARALKCPEGYECQTGETDRVQVASCPIGLICIEKAVVPKALVCPSGYDCQTGETDRIQVSSCPVGFICIAKSKPSATEEYWANFGKNNSSDGSAVLSQPQITPQTTEPPSVGQGTIQSREICTPITINGNTYSLEPCMITESMVDGRGNKSFSVKIIANGGYGFGVRGDPDGFPGYGIMGGTSGSTSGNKTLNLYFNDSVLSSDGSKSKSYIGHLPIHIYLGSSLTGPDSGLLNLFVNLTVTPAN